jgi:hypothetical protein
VTRRGAQSDPYIGVKNYGSSCHRSGSAQIVGRGFAGPSIGDNVERDLLSLVEAMQSGAFDCADVHEDILAAVIWLDEAEAFLSIEPLHGSLRHIFSFRYVCRRAARGAAGSSRFGVKSSVRRGVRGEAKSFGRSSTPVYGNLQFEMQG